MAEKLDWARDGAGWPNAAASRFVTAAGFSWHVQVMGAGPVLLLVHGTGAATHSWRAVLPLLAERFTVIAPDLPGHGFTATPDSRHMSLPGMARALAGLLQALDIVPEAVVGHSAGSAILARMCLDGLVAPSVLVSFNGAFLPLPAIPVELFQPLARLMVSVPLVSRIAARQASAPRALARLMEGTGSVLDAEGMALYGRLVANAGHVAGALAMMARWDLRGLERDLKRLATRLVLVTGSNDQTIPPGMTVRMRRLLPGAEAVSMPGLGHLAHEEAPARAVEIILEAVG